MQRYHTNTFRKIRSPMKFFLTKSIRCCNRSNTGTFDPLLLLELIDLLSSLPKSSNGISPGGTNPDLNLSTTLRESCEKCQYIQM